MRYFAGNVNTIKRGLAFPHPPTPPPPPPSPISARRKEHKEIIGVKIEKAITGHEFGLPLELSLSHLEHFPRGKPVRVKKSIRQLDQL